MRRFYRLSISGEFRDIGPSPLYVWVRCKVCGQVPRVQARDLDVELQPEVDALPSVATTVDGDLVVIPEVVTKLNRIGIQLGQRPVTRRGAPSHLTQILPVEWVHLTDNSMLAPLNECAQCGGTANIKGGPIELHPECITAVPQFAKVRGAPKMIIYSEEVAAVFQLFEPRYAGSLVSGFTGKDTPETDWSDL